MLIGDDMIVIINTTLPSSMLKKKANAILYHKIRKSVACKIMKFVFVQSTENTGDIFTKLLEKPKFYPLVEPYLFRKPHHLTIFREKAKEKK